MGRLFSKIGTFLLKICSSFPNLKVAGQLGQVNFALGGTLPENLNLIKNVEDTVVFLTLNVFISASFSIASYKLEMLKSLLQRNRK